MCNDALHKVHATKRPEKSGRREPWRVQEDAELVQRFIAHRRGAPAMPLTVEGRDLKACCKQLRRLQRHPDVRPHLRVPTPPYPHAVTNPEGASLTLLCTASRAT